MRQYLPIFLALAATPAWAITVNITSVGATGTINGATFTQTDQQPTGSGVIGSFLRIQAKGNENGYNTGGGTPLNDKGGISLNNGDLSVSDLAGNCVLLDVNQAQGGDKKFISLDSLQVYTSPTHNQTTANVSSLGTLVYDLGAGNNVFIDSSLGHGSGSGDVEIDFPTSMLTGANSTDAVYLYAKFSSANGGFEEFALLLCTPTPPGGGGNPPPVPEPAALSLLPLALIGLGLRKRFER